MRAVPDLRQVRLTGGGLLRKFRDAGKDRPPDERQVKMETKMSRHEELLSDLRLHGICRLPLLPSIRPSPVSTWEGSDGEIGAPLEETGCIAGR